MATLQFVDSIASSPTLRLDINDGTNFNLFRDPDFSPPPLKRVRTATLMTDGDYIAATAYANRVIRLKLRAHGTTKDNLATNLQTLDRELDRKNNILKWQSTNATNPVFFRTFRSPDYKLEVGLNQSGDALNDVVVTLTIEAEPFAYGLRVTGSPVTVNNDPAAGSNPCYFDVTGVTGDVPTPAFIQFALGATSSAQKTLFAVRQHGTPGGVYIIQAESMTLGTNTTLPGNDGVMSGAGSNYARTAFANANMDTRLSSTSFPAAASVEIRGSYRIFARLRKTTATDVVKAQVVCDSMTTEAVTVPSLADSAIHWVDLGVITIPNGFSDPVEQGYGNVAQSVEPVNFSLKAQRVSGTGNLDWDAIIPVPADEALAIIDHHITASGELVLDGPKDMVYERNASARLASKSTAMGMTGSILELKPNQTNRIVVLGHVDTATGDDITDTWSVTVSYWPRWLYVRP